MYKILIFSLLLISNLFANLETDKNLVTKTLENGVKIFIYENQTPKNVAEFYMYINAGSTNETTQERGLAHFVEHMIFNGTKDYAKNALIEKLESLGVKFGADLNGATSFDRTYYKIHIDAKPENLAEAVKILQNMAFFATFNEADVENEKGVIIEEERMRNDADMRVFKQEIPFLFRDSIYASRLPIGDMEVIKNATASQLREFYHKNYKPENITLICVGDVESSEILKLFKTHFNREIKAQKNLTPNRKIGFFNELVSFNAHDKELKNQSVNVYFEDFYKGGVRNFIELKEQIKMRYIARLIGLLSDQKSSVNEIKNKISFGLQNLYNQKVLQSFSQNVLNDDFKGSLSEIFAMIKSIEKYGFSNENFQSIKSEFIAANQSFKSSENTQNSQFYLHKILNFIENNSTILSNADTYKLTQNALNEITLNEINEKFRQIVNRGGIIVETLSQKPIDFSEFEISKIRQNAEIYDTSKGLNLPKTLLETSKISPKKATKISKTDNDINVIEFKNGAKIFHKELKTKKDFVLINALKIGGLSNFKNPKTANLAVNISNKSGLGGFNDYQTSLITANERFSVNKFLGEISLGYAVQATTKDTKNAIKAVFADIKNAKIDEFYLSRFKEIWLDNYEKNLQNSDFKFQKDFNSFIWQNSGKKELLNDNDVKNFSLLEAENFIDQNFKNGEIFTFFVVGDIKKDEIVKIGEKYIANLHFNGKIGEILDDGARLISGEKNFKRNYLKENLAKAQILIHKNAKFSLKNALNLEAATQILSVKLREIIREKNSLVYNISAFSHFSKLPYERTLTTISFTSEPKNIAKIKSLIKEILKDLKTQKIEQSYIENFKIQKITELEKSFQSPEFWLKSMQNSFILNEKFLNQNEMIEMVKNLNENEIKTAILDYLQSENFIFATNYYEKF